MRRPSARSDDSKNESGSKASSGAAAEAAPGSKKQRPVPPSLAKGARSKGSGSKKSGGWRGDSWQLLAAGAVLLLLGVAGMAALLWLPQVIPTEQAKKRTNPHVTPLDAPKVTDSDMFQGEHKQQLLWGTYRSHLYLGIRPRLPKSLVAGLMWLAPRRDSLTLRHFCEQGDPVMRRYGWLRHDGRKYGRQNIIDGPYNITTFFAKSFSEGSGYGGDWTARLAIKRAKPPISRSSSAFNTSGIFFFYVADETGTPLRLKWPSKSAAAAAIRTRRAVLVEGESETFGRWQLHVNFQRAGGSRMAAQAFPLQHLHNLTDQVRINLQRAFSDGNRLELHEVNEPNANFAILQILVQLPSELDFVFVSGLRPLHSANARVEALSGPALDSRILTSEGEFDKRFKEAFPLPPDVLSMDGAEETMKAALSNLIGGMGYFHGSSRVAIPKPELLSSPPSPPYWLYWPAALFSAVPSRSFFPRGFLWDEGFHQLIVSRWDPLISMDSIAHWLDLLNSNGWIPREQILGAEARSKVPEEFVLQHTTNANPPTLLLPLLEIARRIQATPSPSPSPSSSSSEAEGASDWSGGKLSQQQQREFLRRSFPRVKAWFRWFNESQRGAEDDSFFWHGRDAATNRELNPKTLMSGLDDYPRASHPSPRERHLDLRCWMMMAAEAVAEIGAAVGEDVEVYRKLHASLANVSRLNQLHLDPKTKQYLDFGNHSEQVSLHQVQRVDPSTGAVSFETVRRVTKKPRQRLVPHFGYVSLFPLIMKMLPPSDETLGHQLQLLRNESLLWTDFGLRSLATTSSLYMKRNTEHDPPYWRGPVWINLNYLTLGALKHYATVEGPFAEEASQLYRELRGNVLRNIVTRYRESGYLWEQYDNEKEGEGKGAHPFTGWTALIVAIASEKF